MEYGEKIKPELGDNAYHFDSYLNVIFETPLGMELGTALDVAGKIFSNIVALQVENKNNQKHICNIEIS